MPMEISATVMLFASFSVYFKNYWYFNISVTETYNRKRGKRTNKEKIEAPSVMSEYPQDGGSVCGCCDYRVDAQM